MATILIQPVVTQSIGSFSVEITGIDPTSHDCLIGNITTPGQGVTEESWDLNGLMRGGSAPLNLDIRSDDLAGVISLAKHLGAPA
jgi:hypothetical protein